MTDLTQPRGSIKPQVLSNSPIPTQTTIMDDVVALMDDPTALMGGVSTQIPVLRTSAGSNAPKGSVKQRR